MRCVAAGSSAEHGSSISSTSGSLASVRAMQRRCCWPPERLVPGASSRSFTSSHSAACRRARSTRSGMSRSGARALRRGPYATLSKMLLGNGFGRWNTMPTSRRSAADLDQIAGVEERGVVRDAAGLLQVVRDDDDGVAALELVAQLLVSLRAAGTELYTLSLHDALPIFVGERARDAEALLLAA